MAMRSLLLIASVPSTTQSIRYHGSRDASGGRFGREDHGIMYTIKLRRCTQGYVRIGALLFMMIFLYVLETTPLVRIFLYVLETTPLVRWLFTGS